MRSIALRRSDPRRCPAKSIRARRGQERGGDTYLIADENDDGQLDSNDFFVRFEGTHNFVQGDFDATTFVIAGTNGDDVIIGMEGDDIIFAAGGSDQVFALGGSDEVHGGTGNDMIAAGTGEFDFDQLFGDAGDDTISLQNSSGSAFGGDGDDLLIGSDLPFGFDDLHGDAGNDELRAGASGSELLGGSGADRLVSGAGDDLLDGGRDETTSELDGAEDLFVYTGAGRWSEEGSFFGDTMSGFDDGIDRIDLRGSGLQFSDLVIDNDGDFGPTVTSERGQITLSVFFPDEVVLDESDFVFDPPIAPVAQTGGDYPFA